MTKKKSSSSLRPKSASTSFILSDNKNKENMIMNHSMSSFDDIIDYDSESDLSFVFDKKPNQKQRLRSKSAKTLRASSLNPPEPMTARNPLKPLKPLKYTKSQGNKKKKQYGFMKPTLSAYLLTNNPTKMLASC